MPKITTVDKARKSPGKCGGCGTDIGVGQPYRHWSFRYGGKRVRCMEPGCAPRSSDLTSNDKLATLYAAVESAEDAIDAWDGEEISDLEAILADCASEIRDVAEMYREIASNIEDGFGHATYQSEEAESNAEDLDSFADDVEGASLDGFDVDEDLTDEENEEAREQWADEQRNVARDAVQGSPL
jgi:hypothetical protein